MKNVNFYIFYFINIKIVRYLISKLLFKNLQLFYVKKL